MAKVDRRMWSKINAPQEITDLFYMIARKQGYSHEDGWRFLLQLLKDTYPEDVRTLEEYLGIPRLLESLTASGDD